jgi:hypothetical protein
MHRKKKHKIFNITRQVVTINRIKITLYFLSPPKLFLLICTQILIPTFKHNVNIITNAWNGGNAKRKKKTSLFESHTFYFTNVNYISIIMPLSNLYLFTIFTTVIFQEPKN